MTMNIAIVDEEKFERETAEVYLRKYIRENWAKHESKIYIETFSRARDFMGIFSRGMYQLVLVGFCTENLAKFLRARDNDVEIFYLPHEDDCEENFL